MSENKTPKSAEKARKSKKKLSKEDCEELRRRAEEEVPEAKAEVEVDPLAFQASIDPYFDPSGAKRQLKARRLAKQLQDEEKQRKLERRTEKEAARNG